MIIEMFVVFCLPSLIVVAQKKSVLIVLLSSL